MEPEKTDPPEWEPLGLDASPAEEEARRADLKLERKLAKENMSIRPRWRAAEERVRELEARLAEGAPADEELKPLRHRDAVRVALDGYDFVQRGARAKAVAELIATTRVEDDGALVLVDDESDEVVPVTDEVLRSILPKELLHSHATGGSGAKRPDEIPFDNPARDQDKELIEKAQTSQAFFDQHRPAVIAAMKRQKGPR